MSGLGRLLWSSGRACLPFPKTIPFLYPVGNSFLGYLQLQYFSAGVALQKNRSKNLERRGCRMRTGKSADVHSEGASSQQPSARLPALMGTLFVLLFLLS